MDFPEPVSPEISVICEDDIVPRIWSLEDATGRASDVEVDDGEGCGGGEGADLSPVSRKEEDARRLLKFECEPVFPAA